MAKSRMKIGKLRLHSFRKRVVVFVFGSHVVAFVAGRSMTNGEVPLRLHLWG